jgi:uncharacterized protein YjiK
MKNSIVGILGFLLFSSFTEFALNQYHLNEPTVAFELPVELQEISGMAFIDKENIACEQDETGVIYIYNIEQKKVLNKITFAGKGDYEDISIVGKNAYVLDSRGIVYEIQNFQTSNRQINHYNFSVSNESNAEAMCYDVKTNRLLITFKESKGIKSSKKSIYFFDLATHSMKESPVITITLGNIREQMNQEKKKGEKRVHSSASINNVFAPSCMAINPLDGNIYLISSHNKVMLVIDETGKVLKYYFLPRSVFMQPEGITFSSSGDLFISNEGNKSNGNILKFNYVQ